MDTCNKCGANCIIEQCKDCELRCCKNCSISHNDTCSEMRTQNYHFCKAHDLQVCKYCKECDRLICLECINDDHIEHCSIDIKDGISSFAGDVNVLKKAVTKHEAVLEKHRQTLGEHDELISSEQSRLFQNLHAELEEVKNEADFMEKKTPNVAFLSKLSIAKRRMKMTDEKMRNFEDLICSRNQTASDIRQLFQTMTKTTPPPTEEKGDDPEETVEDSFEMIHMYEVKDEEIRFLKEENQFYLELSNTLLEWISEIEKATMEQHSRTFTHTENKNRERFIQNMESTVNLTVKIKNKMIHNEDEAKKQQLKINELELARRGLKNQCTQLQTTNHENKELREKLRQNDELLRKSENKVKTLQSSIREFEFTIRELSDQCSQLRKSLKENTKVNEQLRQENDKLTKGLLSQQRACKQKQDEIESMHLSLDKLTLLVEKKDAEIQKLINEKDDLQTRLSAIAGNKLTKGNPNVTDLSDPNRPMKIGEKYGELYDNEWTDALECTDKIREMYPTMNKNEIEEVIIHHLHRLLMCCYQTCLKLSAVQLDDLRNAVRNMTCLDVDGEQFLGLDCLKDILAVRRQTTEDFIQSFLKDKGFDESIVLRDWTYQHKNKDFIALLMKSPFYEKCANLCWGMAIQDPVMCLDDETKAGSKYDKNTHKDFLQSGDTVQFVVWPALFLHKCGPLLCKGVVQAFCRKQ